jgi:hypothetical protein
VNTNQLLCIQAISTRLTFPFSIYTVVSGILLPATIPPPLHFERQHPQSGPHDSLAQPENQRQPGTAMCVYRTYKCGKCGNKWSSDIWPCNNYTAISPTDSTCAIASYWNQAKPLPVTCDSCQAAQVAMSTQGEKEKAKEGNSK